MTCKDKGFYPGVKVKSFTGKYYQIIGYALHVEQGEWAVIYKELTPPYRLLVMHENFFCDELDQMLKQRFGCRYRFELVEDNQ